MKTALISLQPRVFGMGISMKLVYQYVVIFFNFQTTSNHLHPLQVENCGSNSRLVVDDDDYGKLRLERDEQVNNGSMDPGLETKCIMPSLIKI